MPLVLENRVVAEVCFCFVSAHRQPRIQFEGETGPVDFHLSFATQLTWNFNLLGDQTPRRTVSLAYHASALFREQNIRFRNNLRLPNLKYISQRFLVPGCVAIYP